jgi:hypothetical protein
MVFNIAEMIRSTALRLAAVVLAAFLVLVSPSWAGEVTTYTGRSMIDGDSVRSTANGSGYTASMP